MSPASRSTSTEGNRQPHTGTLPPLGPAALADLVQNLTRLDQMASTVPLDAPWQAPNALQWDAMTFGQWLDANVGHGGGEIAVHARVFDHQWPGPARHLVVVRAVRDPLRGRDRPSDRYLGRRAELALRRWLAGDLAPNGPPARIARDAPDTGRSHRPDQQQPRGGAQRHPGVRRATRDRRDDPAGRKPRPLRPDADHPTHHVAEDVADRRRLEDVRGLQEAVLARPGPQRARRSPISRPRCTPPTTRRRTAASECSCRSLEPPIRSSSSVAHHGN